MDAAGGTVVYCGHKEARPPNTTGSHGVEGHPPDESLRWDETPLVAVRPTSLRMPCIDILHSP